MEQNNFCIHIYKVNYKFFQIEDQLDDYYSINKNDKIIFNQHSHKKKNKFDYQKTNHTKVRYFNIKIILNKQKNKPNVTIIRYLNLNFSIFKKQVFIKKAKLCLILL